MRWIAPIAHEIFGLFVDDAKFAVAIIFWLAVVALLMPLIPLPAAWHGPVLFAGLAIVLVWNCLYHIGHRVVRRAQHDA